MLECCRFNGLGLFKNAWGDAGANVGTRRVRVDHEVVILEWQAIWRMGAGCGNAADRKAVEGNLNLATPQG